ncbi:hypothetical protein AMTRI_Chr03g49900 [Amborella trichopoda]|uniref:Pentacotripeptide-repeat region of PRORP domain-containing protein n=1 Tax=Amborella trichopoda TaxID=13333 RepID=W1NGX3_AMBTC|nr:pentatricopeptide repeat-containing protein At4g37170 [Amborella trichopoda]ERM94696.1 hypothetical protein AMTR_s00011p00233950 [Amborella trichopoda]|eukprot:XP_006878551.1 pentatricopeptide repeat-containing protein At4g37170 [Amborella trichopoda]
MGKKNPPHFSRLLSIYLNSIVSNEKTLLSSLSSSLTTTQTNSIFSETFASAPSPSLSSSSPSPSSPPIFFRDNGLINRMCREKRFKEAVDHLCQQKRLREAINILNLIDPSNPHQFAPIYASLLQACAQQRALDEGKTVHSHMLSSPSFEPGLFLFNRLLDVYIKCNSLNQARQLFDEMTQKDICSYNTLIAGYCKVGDLCNAKKLFDEMDQRDNFSWSSIISGYVRHGSPNEALSIFREMKQNNELGLNKFTASSALAACAASSSPNQGRELHAHITRTGLESDAIVWSALSDMYAKCGSITEARYVFDRILERDTVAWTTMIGRYVQAGQASEALQLFYEMVKQGDSKPNEFTFVGVLSACAMKAAEKLGREVHGYMVRAGFDPSGSSVSALVDMYAKCGNIKSAENIFQSIPNPDLITWTAIISGSAKNGRDLEALQYFETLLNLGKKPDHVTFVGVLTACTHAGLVEKGLEIFVSIKGKHGLEHTSEHYACIVDLLSKAGRFREAMAIVDTMPMKHNKFLWASLLGACRTHGNLELARKAAEALFEIEPENGATYVTLGNIYADAGMWEEVERVRRLMEDRGIVKKPGSSWIEREEGEVMVES